ncbi:hypothetical protein OPKNFCMD_4512 [Methylobacterium crusticola]|uniref:Uncharacterized protein n=1 Tax=Methylobacterium crusticola TaxID=1697972 RepID=A0ABQ4R4P1_9HYPH|nr:hypothetical protein OPKNFCMD_4512 [Methylobacterium crusticola]
MLRNWDPCEHGPSLGTHDELPVAFEANQLVVRAHFCNYDLRLFKRLAQVRHVNTFVVMNEGAPIEEVEVETRHDDALLVAPT